VISILNGNLTEVINTHKIFLRNFPVPRITECAVFFLLLRIQHFHINIKDPDWLRELESRNLVEDLYKHLYATIEFIEGASTNLADSKKAIYKLKEEANNSVLYTIEGVTEGRRANQTTDFTKSFATENDFVKSVKDTKQTATFPPDLSSAYKNALNTGRLELAANLLREYIKKLGLARSSTAK